MSMTAATRRAFSSVAMILLSQAEFDVLADIEPGEAGVFLEHHADAVGYGVLDRAAFELDFALRRRREARDQLEQRRFSAAGRTDHGEKLALSDFEIDWAEGVHRLARRRRREIPLSPRAASPVPRTRDHPPVRSVLFHFLEVIRQEPGVDDLGQIDVAGQRAHAFLHLDDALHAVEMDVAFAPIRNAVSGAGGQVA